MKGNSILFTTNAASLLAAASRAMLDGQEHMVVPVIGIREGVLNNIFYSAEELIIFANAWNGVPVPVTHPKDVDGNFITANSPAIEETHNIGRFYNVNFDASSKTLKGELWVNILKATTLGHEALLTRLDAGEKINISTGLWTNTVAKRGVYNGKGYDSIATNIRPDHLAILPDEKGACSVEDGCGTFIHNCADKPACSCKTKDSKPMSIFANAFNVVKKALGFEANEVSHSELRDRLRSALPQDKDSWQYIVDVYDKFFVYEQDSLLFKQGYAVDEADQVSLMGEAVQVFIEKTYKEVASAIKTNTTIQNMKCPKNLALVASLLAANSITAEQEVALKAVPDEAFNLLSFEKPAAPAVVANAAVATTPALSDDERLMLNELKADRDARVTNLRANIKKGYPNIAPEVIDTMTVNQLEGLAKAAPASAGIVDYSLGAGSAQPTVNSEVANYTPPSILTAPVVAK